MPKIFLLREKLSSNFDALLGHPKGQHEETLSRKYGDDGSDDEDELEEVFTGPQRLPCREEQRHTELPQPPQLERKPEPAPEPTPGESTSLRGAVISGLMSEGGGGGGRRLTRLSGCVVRLLLGCQSVLLCLSLLVIARRFADIVR